MKTETLEKIEPGNPFLSDLFHMGATIGKNVTVMYARHNDQEQPYIIICNTNTGERIKVELEEEADTHLADIYNAAEGGATAQPQEEITREQWRQLAMEAAARLSECALILQHSLRLNQLYRANTEGRFGN